MFELCRRIKTTLSIVYGLIVNIFEVKVSCQLGDIQYKDIMVSITSTININIKNLNLLKP